MPERRILMGVVGRPHGVRGLVHVQSYTAEPSDLARYGALSDDAGRAWTLVWHSAGVAALRDAEGRPLADRTAAERLVNTRLYIERDRLPAPGAEEFYLADLVGLRAVSPDGAALGRVMVVHDYGAGASLELEGGAIVPFTRAVVPEVDVSGGTLVIVMPDEVVVPDHLPLPPGEGRGEGQHMPEPTPLRTAPCATLTPALSRGERGKQASP